MIQGIYKVGFTGPKGTGAGVVTIKDGKFTGGDSYLWYRGTFQESNGQISATLQTGRHTAGGGGSVFGQDSVSVTLLGNGNDAGFTVAQPGFTAVATKLADI